MVAVLNNYGGFYNRKVYVNEARKAGATISLPCVNRSAVNTAIYGTEIYLSFDCLLNLEGSLATALVQEREANGPYASLENFILRTGAGLESLIVLISAGAFRFTGIGKKELLWEAHILLSGQKKKERANLLFQAQAKKPVLPALETSVLEDLYDEMELLGFCVSGTLFDVARSDYRGDVLARDLVQYEGKMVRIVAYFIADKTVRTKLGDYMKFGTFLDVEGSFIDTVHFPPSLKEYPLNAAGIYLIEGKVVQDFGCPSIEVSRIGRMPLKPDPRSE
jgi:DNA polymerase-3 subunit alpha